MLKISEIIMKIYSCKGIQYKDDSEKKRKKTIILLLAIITLLVCCRMVSIFVFQELDDYFFNRFVSGKETGIHENQLYFIKILLGTVLKGLYQINSMVPWFPIFLEGCLICYCFVLLFNLLKQNNSLIGDGLTVVLFGILFSMMFLPQIIHIQFTVAASALCCAVVVLIATAGESKSVYLISFVMAMLAFQTRYECFYLAVPFVGMGMLIKLMRYSDKKKVIRNSILFACACVVGIFLGIIINNVAYGSEEWKSYIEYTKVRSQLWDYLDVPVYEDNESLFDELNISESEWSVMRNGNQTFTQDIGVSELERITQWTRSVNKKPVTEILMKTVEVNLKSVPALSAIICLGYVFGIVLGICEKDNRKKIYLQLVVMKLVTAFVWLYIVYRGRYPQRIVISLYYLEFACLYSVLTTYFAHERASASMRKAGAKFWAVGLIGIFLMFGMRYVWNTRAYAVQKMEYSVSYHELLNYFNVNEQNFYYCDVSVVSGGITNGIFSDDIECINQVKLGGWLPRCPLYKEKFEQYELSGTELDLYKDNVFIVFRGVDTDAKDNLEAYLREKDERIMFVTVEILETFQGRMFEIVKVEKSS